MICRGCLFELVLKGVFQSQGALMKIRNSLSFAAMLICGTCFADLAADICPSAQNPQLCQQTIESICANPTNCASLTQSIKNCNKEPSCIKAAVESYR
jgi:hypothetical protein